MKGIGRTVKIRRKQGKTDYKARLNLLKSGKPRVVVRKTNRYIIGQIIVSEIAQDKTVIGVSSKDLLNLGWPKEAVGGLKNLTAAYLTGYLLGVKSKKIKEGVLDIGLQRSVKSSRVYAFLKGLVDSGFEISHSKDVFPKEDVLKKNEKLIKEVKNSIK